MNYSCYNIILIAWLFWVILSLTLLHIIQRKHQTETEMMEGTMIQLLTGRNLSSHDVSDVVTGSYFTCLSLSDLSVLRSPHSRHFDGSNTTAAAAALVTIPSDALCLGISLLLQTQALIQCSPHWAAQSWLDTDAGHSLVTRSYSSQTLLVSLEVSLEFIHYTH